MSPACTSGTILRVFLTGGSGFLGSHVAAELVRRGHEVVCLYREGSDTSRLAPVRDALVLAPGDLRRPAEVAAAISKCRPEAVCHTAWQGVFNADRNDPRQFENVAFSATLASQAVAAGVSTFIATGSQAEYGPLNRAARESDPLQPTTAYGRAKCETRDALQSLCEGGGVRFAWLRVFSLYGPGDNEGWLIPSLIKSLQDKQTPSLTAGEQMWDFLYVADAARAVADVVDSPAAVGAFNLGSGHAQPLRRVIEMVRDLVAPEAALGFGKVPYRPDQVMHLEADIQRLVEAVGWRPTTDLAEGLTKTVSWYRGKIGPR